MQVVDAYALIGDASGLAEKIQSFFMQEILSETHSALKTSLQEVIKLGKSWEPALRSFAVVHYQLRHFPRHTFFVRSHSPRLVLKELKFSAI